MKGGSGRKYAVQGINERLRFLKYDPGEFFASHYDGHYMRDFSDYQFSDRRFGLVN